jgi:hypothetical protein
MFKNLLKRRRLNKITNELESLFKSTLSNDNDEFTRAKNNLVNLLINNRENANELLQEVSLEYRKLNDRYFGGLQPNNGATFQVIVLENLLKQESVPDLKNNDVSNELFKGIKLVGPVKSTGNPAYMDSVLKVNIDSVTQKPKSFAIT